MRALSIRARKILATNSMPTVEIEIETGKGKVRSSAPMGTSRGKYEAYQMPAEDALRKFNMVKRFFTSNEFASQRDVDKVIRQADETSHFREIGGNLAIAISSAFLKALALESGVDVWQYVAKEYGTKPKMPAPLCNVVGGWQGQNEFQEFLFLPVHQNSFAKSLFKMTEAYRTVGDALEREDPTFRRGKNIESAWVTSLPHDRILGIMKKIADDMMLKIGIDVAASQIYNGGFYHYRGGVRMNHHEQFSFIEAVARKYPISYIEDPFQEDDWLSFSTAVGRWQPRIVCGDDFYATRIHRLLSSIDKKASNGAMVKPNQVGTITDAAEFAKEAKSRGVITIFSHRSGETDDPIGAQLATGLGCDYAKFGISGERVVKLNELLRIEEAMLGREEKQMSGYPKLAESLRKLREK